MATRAAAMPRSAPATRSFGPPLPDSASRADLRCAQGSGGLARAARRLGVTGSRRERREDARSSEACCAIQSSPTRNGTKVPATLPSGSTEQMTHLRERFRGCHRQQRLYRARPASSPSCSSRRCRSRRDPCHVIAKVLVPTSDLGPPWLPWRRGDPRQRALCSCVAGARPRQRLSASALSMSFLNLGSGCAPLR